MLLEKVDKDRECLEKNCVCSRKELLSPPGSGETEAWSGRDTAGSAVSQSGFQAGRCDA